MYIEIAYSHFPLLSTLIFLPILCGGALLFLPLSPRAGRIIALVVSLLELIPALILLGRFDFTASGFQAAESLSWVPAWGLSYSLGIDGLSLLMLLLTCLLLPLCVLCSWRAVTRRGREFHACLLLTAGACLGVFSALDFVLFFIFWEGMIIPMYFIIAVWGGPERRYAALKFFLYTLAGGMALLAAIIAFFVNSGTFFIPELMVMKFGPVFQLWTFAAMGLAFVVKVPLFPLHAWLPSAHVEAPAAGSVILASVLLKMGAYGFLRFCLPITPYGAEFFTPLMLALAVISILYGGLAALGQGDLKRLIAYSSVAHMGFCLLGVFSGQLSGLRGAVLIMVSHGLVTGALFFLIGFIYERSHSRLLADMQNLGGRLPAWTAFFAFFALAALGFPCLAPFVGEFLAIGSAFARLWWLGALVIPGAMLGAAYMLRPSLQLIWGSTPAAAATRRSWKDLLPREWLVLVPLAALTVLLGLLPGLILKTTARPLEAVRERMTEARAIWPEDPPAALYPRIQEERP